MVSEAIKTKILNLRDKGHKPQAIFETLKGETRGLKKNHVQYVINYASRRKAAATPKAEHNPNSRTNVRTKDDRSEMAGLVITSIMTLAAMHNVPAEKRLKAIKEIL